MQLSLLNPNKHTNPCLLFTCHSCTYIVLYTTACIKTIKLFFLSHQTLSLSLGPFLTSAALSYCNGHAWDGTKRTRNAGTTTFGFGNIRGGDVWCYAFLRSYLQGNLRRSEFKVQFWIRVGVIFRRTTKCLRTTTFCNSTSYNSYDLWQYFCLNVVPNSFKSNFPFLLALLVSKCLAVKPTLKHTFSIQHLNENMEIANKTGSKMHA